MSRTWILVAESSRAKLYEADGNLAPLSELEDLVHPAGRMHEGDLVSDRAGNDGGSIGQGRHVIDDKTSAREQEKLEFARQLALNAGYRLEWEKIAAPAEIINAFVDSFNTNNERLENLLDEVIAA